MSETIFRVEKNAENPYVMIDKNVFEDTSLSFKAKGILGYLLSRPNDWTLIIADIQKRSTDGKDSVKNGIDELIERGYIVKTEQPRQAGKFATCDYVVYEKPMNTGVNRCGKTVAVKPSRLNRHGKSATTNNNKLNNELLKKDINSGDGKKTKPPKIDDKPKQPKQPSKETLQALEIIEYWNNNVDSAKQVKAETWVSKAKGRLKIYSLDEIKQAMNFVISNHRYNANNQVLIKNVISSNERLETVLAKYRQSQAQQGIQDAINQPTYSPNHQQPVSHFDQLRAEAANKYGNSGHDIRTVQPVITDGY